VSWFSCVDEDEAEDIVGLAMGKREGHEPEHKNTSTEKIKRLRAEKPKRMK
jgi:hypothetical protein